MRNVRAWCTASLVATALAVACADGSTISEPVAIAAGGGEPEACAEWSCDENVCDGPTAPPNHACCIRSIYDPPGSYTYPEDPAEEPTCVDGPECDVVDNECFWASGTCHYSGNVVGPFYCSEDTDCRNDPITFDECSSRYTQGTCET